MRRKKEQSTGLLSAGWAGAQRVRSRTKDVGAVPPAYFDLSNPAEAEAERVAEDFMFRAPVEGAGRWRAESGVSAPLDRRLAFDLSQVRIHTDSRAARSARALGARAYTFGRDIVFGEGEFQPRTARGQRLLVHELTHVGQQQGTGVPRLQRQALPGSIASPRLARLLGRLTLDEFALNSAALTPNHLGQLRAHAGTLRDLLASFPGGTVIITGHADASGTTEYNEALGRQRGEAVLLALQALGIDAGAISVRSAGESEPTRGAGGGEVASERGQPRDRRAVIEFRPTLPVRLGSDLELSRDSPRRPNLQFPSSAPPSNPSPWFGPLPAAPTPRAPSPIQVRPGGLVWLEVAINEPPPLPPEARIAGLFRSRGIHLTQAELNALMAGRADGIQALEAAIATLAPGVDPQTRGRWARSIADALMSGSLRSQLEREQPSARERDQQRSRQLQDLLGSPPGGPAVEGGIRLLIYF